jgi:hypothetical protein
MRMRKSIERLNMCTLPNVFMAKADKNGPAALPKL